VGSAFPAARKHLGLLRTEVRRGVASAGEVCDSAAAMIRFEDVSHDYAAGRPVLREIGFEVARGELLVVLGESGSGKTTLLKTINRLIEPDRGTVSVAGVDVRRRDPIELRRSIGYVLQRFGLFPHLTLAENVAVVPRLQKRPPRELSDRADELLTLVGLAPAEYRDRFPHELSGGQQQRVGFARALAGRPEVMLMDEPFGAIDAVTRDRLQIEYRRLHERLGLTTVMVTHDVTEALLLGDRILVLDRGKIAQLATPAELLGAPNGPRVAALLETPRRQLDRLKHLAEHPAA
jgi:osmoprotectant transport system ATP-binding protein